MDRFDPLFQSNSEPLGVLLAAMVVFGTGLADDIWELSAPAKVTGTVVGGMILVWFGVTMYYFRVPFLDVFYLSTDWTPLITVLWLIGMTQAINLIDGLDGLAAGIVLIAASAFFIYSRRLGDLGFLEPENIGPLIAIIAVGVCLGFLPHNFNPARIFMGDGGALLLGLLMAVSTSVVGGRADPGEQAYIPGQTYFFLAPIFIPLVILGVPILDTTVRDRAPGQPAPGLRHRRQGPPPPSSDEPRSRAAAQRDHPLAVDRGAQRVRALPGVHQRLDAADPARRDRPRPRPVHGAAPAGTAGPGGDAERPHPPPRAAAEPAEPSIELQPEIVQQQLFGDELK